MHKTQKICLALAACVAISAAGPVTQTSYPVLKKQPAEVLFRADNASTVLLECTTEGKEKDVKYSWQKDGKPFNWESVGHIGQRPGEGSIMFFNPQPSDEGLYQCFAETKAGIASTRQISLKKAFLTTPQVKTQEHTVIEGVHYKLDCPIPESYPKPTIEWKTQSMSDPKITGEVFSKRITEGPDGNLYFSNITESDVNPTFKYICVAKSPAVSEEVILAAHLLKELEPNKMQNKNGVLVPQYVSNDMMAKAGDVTMIYCIYGGTPLGHPDWFKDGKDANGQPNDRVTRYNRTAGKRLLIKKTLLEDSGTYKCVADNEVGEKQSHTMKLTVVSAPQLTQELDKQISTKDGQDVKIPCPIVAKPAATISWTYNTKPLGDKGTYKDGFLTIKNAKKADTGYYGCKAENEHGVLYSETLVHVA